MVIHYTMVNCSDMSNDLSAWDSFGDTTGPLKKKSSLED